jgi:phosphatidylinositol glycan class B
MGREHAVSGVEGRDIASLYREVEKQLRSFDWPLISLLALALLVRVGTIIEFPSLNHADENFQLFEQGHRYFFGTGLVPWEFRDGTRSPVLPFLLGLIFAASEPLVGGPEGYILVARLLLALSSLAAVIAVYRMGRRVSSVHAVLSGLVTATWFEFVYFAGRPLTEALATTVLLVGLPLASVPEPELTRKRLIYIGLCFGLCLMLRMHLLFGILIAGIWVGRWHMERWAAMAVGALVPVGIFGIGDAMVWGLPFRSYFEAVRFNVFEGVASKFSTSPVDWYLRLFVSSWSYAAPLLLLLMLLGTRRSGLWFVVALGILLSHSLIPHKEYRFVFPASACLMIVAAMASGDLIQSARAQGQIWSVTLMSSAIACAWLSIYLAFAPNFKFQWFKSRELIEAEFLLAKQPRLCGILFYDYEWWKTGGYAYLHRNVPLYQLPERSAINALKVADAFNAVLVKRSSVADFSKKFFLLRCLGSGTAGDVCVMMREGNCRSLVEFSPLSQDPAAFAWPP